MANAVAEKKKTGLSTYLNNDAVKNQVESVVGKANMQRFVSSVVSAVQTNPALAECSNTSILSAALLGESLQLPPSPQLGFFYMVPYNSSKTGKQATFQLGYKGYIQLAIRSGQYRKITATEVKEGELKSYNPLTEDFVLDPILDEIVRNKKPTIGYYGMLELMNGFRKEVYWSKEKMEEHAKKYSTAYRKGWDSTWKTDFDLMGKKTILRQLISKWGIMSVEMQKAFESDMGVVNEDGTVDYVDNVQDAAEVAKADIAENANQEDFQIPEDVIDVDAEAVKDAPFK